MQTIRFWVLSFFSLTFLSALSATVLTNDQIALRPLSEDVVGTQPYVEQSSKQGVIVLNGRDRTIRTVQNGHQLVKFGSFGTGPGELYNPVIAVNKSFVVDVEWTTQRVQWFSTDGKYLRTCHLASSLDTRTAALTDDNVLLLNDSHGANPLVFMDQSCNVIKRVGSRVKVSDLYGAANFRKDSEYADASNRVELAVDDGSIYSAYLVAPVVSKYDRAGNLLYRVSLNHAVDNDFWKYVPGSGELSTGVDGTQVPIITRGISVDPITHKLWVLSTEALKGHVTLYCISQDGKVVRRLPLISPLPNGEISGMAVYKETVYLSLVFARGVYFSPLPSM